MGDELVLAVLELYTEMGCLLREAQRLLPPEAFRQMIDEKGIDRSVAKRSMQLADEFDGLPCG